jgi:energy-coupling factor transporter transmembrane protein EcfT
MFGIELSMHDLFMYLGTPAAILTLLITLYATYRPMKHYPPLFIMMLYALLGVLYTCVIGYVGYRKLLSISSCILLCILFVVVVISIFVYTPSTYDSNIDEVEEKFLKDKIYQPDELNQLRQELMTSFSDKNKYYIQWFIALLYVPLVVHWRYKCELNPVAYTFIYNYIMNLLNLKKDKMDNSLIHQSNDLLETLKELDKTITYTSTEKQLIDKIRESIVNKEKIKF